MTVKGQRALWVACSSRLASQVGTSLGTSAGFTERVVLSNHRSKSHCNSQTFLTCALGLSADRLTTDELHTFYPTLLTESLLVIHDDPIFWDPPFTVVWRMVLLNGMGKASREERTSQGTGK